MKRCFLIACIALMAAPASAAHIRCPPHHPTPIFLGRNPVRFGWHNDEPARYFRVATNNIRFAADTRQGFPLLTPKLSSALVPRVSGGEIAARPVYLVTNFQNPYVFSAGPGDPL